MDLPFFEIAAPAVSYYGKGRLGDQVLFFLSVGLSLSRFAWNERQLSRHRKKEKELEGRISAIERLMKPSMGYCQQNYTQPLGQSGLTMQHYGCYVTSVAQILTLAGYNVDPGTLCSQLNSLPLNVGFTKDGLAVHAGIEKLYPQFKYGGSGYKIVQGKFPNGLYHYMAVKDGVLYDPWTGGNVAPCPLTGAYQNVSVAPAPVVVTVASAEIQPSWPKKVVVTAEPYLNNRTAPTSSAPLAKEYPKLQKGWELEVLGWVDGEDVNGNQKWYKSVRGNYFSAYYCQDVPPTTNNQA